LTERSAHQRKPATGGGYMWVVLSLVFAVAVVGGAFLWVSQRRALPSATATTAVGGSGGSATSPAAAGESSGPVTCVIERSDRVEALQRELKKAGVYSGALDGVYGPATQASLKKLQQQVGVPPTGLFDQTTWKAAVAKNQLKTSQTVMSLQLALKTLGYIDGDINGKYDVDTELGVRAFQRASGMSADGVWSPTLDAAIEQALDGGR
jgi:peptidoglycan hydrolase-like protein with peptidoglycan-binding domain